MQRKILRVHLVQDTITFVSKFLCLLPVVIWMICASIDLRASSVFLALRIYDHTGLIVGRRMYRAYTLYKGTKVSLERIQVYDFFDFFFIFIFGWVLRRTNSVQVVMRLSSFNDGGRPQVHLCAVCQVLSCTWV